MVVVVEGDAPPPAAAAVKVEVMAAPAGPDELDDADEEEPATPLLSGGRMPCILALYRFKKYLLQNPF